MVDENALEIETLDYVNAVVFWGGLMLIAGQFLLVLILSSSPKFFWALINSQLNLVYLPLMAVNTPGQVSFYFDVLILICTFDPIPMEVLY